ncbi:type VI secretion system contractile sheath large subunit, partial [Shewanella sp. 11B5]
MPHETISFVTSEIFKEDTGVNKPVSSTTQALKNKHLVERFLRESDSTRSLLLWLENSSHSLEQFDKTSVLPFLLKAIERIDRQLEQQLNAIIHHDAFQALEASWRGVLYLVQQQDLHDKDQKVKVKMLDCCWTTLSKDINRAIEFDQSDFFKLIYNNEYDMSGGEPFGTLIGDYQITHKSRPGVSTNDIDILKEISRTAAAAFAPFITSASPSLFGADDFSDLSAHMNIAKIFEQHEYIKWNSLRKMDDSRFIGLTMPNILMRSPYLIDGTRSEGFKFKESIKNPKKDHL